MSFMKLRHVADIQNSNVDKVISETEIPVRLCNYVDVYKNDFISLAIDFNAGSATAVEIERFGVKVGDVIITKDSEDRNDIGIPAYVAETADDLVCGYHLTMLRAFKHRADGAFIFWALQSKKAKEAFAIAANGVTRYGLTQEGIKSLELWVPDLPTQKRIAAFLDRETARIDELIAKKERLVDLLVEREENFIRNLLSGAGVDAGRRTESDAPWLQGVPERWEIIPLRHLVKIQTGSRDTQNRVDDGQYPFFVRSMTIERIDSYAFDEEAVMTSGDGAGVGNVFHHVNCKFDLHQRMYAFTGFKKVTGRYFYYFLRTFFKLQMTQWSAKSTVDSVRMPFLKSLLVTVPSKAEQETLVQLIELRADRDRLVKEKTKASIDRLREYRAALITAAVTGQIDVDSYGKSGTPSATLDRIEEEMQG